MFLCSVVSARFDIAVLWQYLLAQPDERSRTQRCRDIGLRFVSSIAPSQRSIRNHARAPWMTV
jgi:hypothetical protein